MDCYDIARIDNVVTSVRLSYSINIVDSFMSEVDMRVFVKKWGNSASIRIPAAIMESAKLQVDSPVDIREEGGRIVIESVPEDEYELDVLLARITPENLHEVCSFGPAVGKEAL